MAEQPVPNPSPCTPAPFHPAQLLLPPNCSPVALSVSQVLPPLPPSWPWRWLCCCQPTPDPGWVTKQCPGEEPVTLCVLCVRGWAHIFSDRNPRTSTPDSPALFFCRFCRTQVIRQPALLLRLLAQLCITVGFCLPAAPALSFRLLQEPTYVQAVPQEAVRCSLKHSCCLWRYPGKSVISTASIPYTKFVVSRWVPHQLHQVPAPATLALAKSTLLPIMHPLSKAKKHKKSYHSIPTC